MHEIHKLIRSEQHKPHGRGRVAIEYLDPHTEKIKERFEGENCIFPYIFETDQWYRFFCVRGTAFNPNFWIMDDPSPTELDFPWLTGTPLAHGWYTAASSGNHRISWVEGESFFNRKITGEALGISNQYCWEILPNQIPHETPPRSFGLTCQFQPKINDYPAPNRRIPYSQNILTGPPSLTVGERLIFVDGFGYRIHTTNSLPQIMKVNPLNESQELIDISTFGLPAIEPSIIIGSWFLGYNFKTKKPYLFCNGNGTAANRRMYEFSDLTFTRIDRTWSPTNIANPTFRIFWVDDTFMYWWTTSGLWRADFGNNSAVVNILSPPSWIFQQWHTGGWGDAYSLIESKGRLFLTASIYITSSNRLIPFFNISNMTVAGWIDDQFEPSNTGHGFLVMNDIANNSGGFLYSNGAHRSWLHRQAVTRYVIPPDTPPRPLNSTMRITYKVDILYDV
jgi:hypothetical protein